MDVTTIRSEVEALATEKGLPLSESQIQHIVGSVVALRECAARVRKGLRRNDEPAFGFRNAAAIHAAEDER